VHVNHIFAYHGNNARALFRAASFASFAASISFFFLCVSSYLLYEELKKLFRVFVKMLVQTFFYNKKRFTLARAQKPLLDPHRHNVSLEKA